MDDKPYILATMKRVLKEDGYLILSAANDAEGFELLATNPVFFHRAGDIKSPLRFRP